MATENQPDFIQGGENSPEQVAIQLLPILAMWGMSRDVARRSAARLATMLNSMSDAEYTEAARGLRIKGGKPENGEAETTLQ